MVTTANFQLFSCRLKAVPGSTPSYLSGSGSVNDIAYQTNIEKGTAGELVGSDSGLRAGN